MLSKPIRLRGLKCNCVNNSACVTLSKPIRLRGLKCLSFLCLYLAYMSKPIRLRGLKFKLQPIVWAARYVEAYTASWIEINKMDEANARIGDVEAYTASWIEIEIML